MRVLIEDTQGLLADGSLPLPVAQRILLPADFELLERPVNDNGWYDIRLYRRLSELLKSHLGHGDAGYIKRRGAAAAERLIAAGMHQQVSYTQRIGPSERLDMAYGNLKLIASIWGTFFNFGTWTPVKDEADSSFSMDVTDALAMPLIAWDVIEGFIARLVDEVDSEHIALTLHRERIVGGMRYRFQMRGRDGD